MIGVHFKTQGEVHVFNCRPSRVVICQIAGPVHTVGYTQKQYAGHL